MAMTTTEKRMRTCRRPAQRLGCARARFAAALGLIGALLAAAAPIHSAVAQQSVRPLTLEGKHALYQRVIAVPGAILVDAIGSDTKDAQPTTPFTVFYVYARETVGGREWLHVGTDSNGRVDGWLPAEQTVEWRQALTVGFKDPAKQPRVLLFEQRDPLKKLVEQGDVAAYEMLRQQAIAGNVSDSPVAAIQPPAFIDIRRNFYLVPILSHEDVLVGNSPARLLQVASVPLRSSAAQSPYRAGIVFVIDTTKSMQPYIERTRDIMREVYRKIDEAGLSDRVSYGLVAFRDSTSAVPALGYVSKVFANLTGSGQRFLAQVKDVQAATTSSEGFDEDPYAGLMQAVDGIDWSGQLRPLRDLDHRCRPPPSGRPAVIDGSGHGRAAGQARGTQDRALGHPLANACGRQSERPRGRRGAIPRAIAGR